MKANIFRHTISFIVFFLILGLGAWVVVNLINPPLDNAPVKMSSIGTEISVPRGIHLWMLPHMALILSRRPIILGKTLREKSLRLARTNGKSWCSQRGTFLPGSRSMVYILSVQHTIVARQRPTSFLFVIHNEAARKAYSKNGYAFFYGKK